MDGGSGVAVLRHESDRASQAFVGGLALVHRSCGITVETTYTGFDVEFSVTTCLQWPTNDSRHFEAQQLTAPLTAFEHDL
jgi:hypothetical protein